jgi:hypothetical protein
MHGTCIKMVMFVCLKCSKPYVVSGFCSKEYENCTLLEYYAVINGNFLPTCLDNLGS